MKGAPAEAVDAAALLVALAFALRRPRRLPEAVAAAPAALLVVAVGATSTSRAAAEASALGPVVGFLAAILVLARLCDDDGLFRALGARLAGIAQRGDRPRTARTLFAAVFAVAAAITAVLSLDATVVLLTPVVLAAASRVRVDRRPAAYACVHLSNSGSLLLPVSNLTNLLAYTASRLSFTRFAALMALPWLAVVGLEYGLLRRVFRRQLRKPPVDPADRPTDAAAAEPCSLDLPLVPLALVAATLAGFVVASFAGVSAAWAAAAGALVLAGRALLTRRATVGHLVAAASLPFCAFVLSLGVIVAGLQDNGLASVVRRVLPSGASLVALLAVAAVAAILANVVNNLPATLLLLPVAAMAGPASVLAMLVGVDVGPNLTPVGSLATLLWRRVLARAGEPVDDVEFARLGLLTVPATIGVGVVGLWAALRLIGT